MQLLIKNTQADVIAIQDTKLKQFHKTLNIPHFTPIKTDHTHKQGGLLTYESNKDPNSYIKNNISFSQFNTSNTSPIEQ